MRHHPRTIALAAVAGLGLLALPAVAAADEAPAGGAFAIDWYTVDGGGGSSSGGGFAVTATVGQPDAGRSTGGPWAIDGGFWAGGIVAAPPCPEDLDGSGTVDFNDLLSVLNAFGTCAGCPEDLDGNGTVDFNDLLTVLNAFGPCP